ncbi:MAG: hypothetical protein J1F37_01820 [Oscillospiraceae bacterium]|nr:hypothetical protein [Oscillospiraceae bacterium]
MKENETESKLKKFIKDAFTSEAKAARIPYYFFAICVLFTIICFQLNTTNRYLKRIANGGSGTYNYQTNNESNDPYVIFSDKSSETTSDEQTDKEPSDVSNSENQTTSEKSEPTTAPTTQNSAEVTSANSTEPKPQGNAATYVINKNSKKIHYPNCSYASNMKEENKLTVKLTSDELKSQYLSNGYTFCSRCAG